MSGVIMLLIWVISIATLLITLVTLVITTHEPRSMTEMESPRPLLLTAPNLEDHNSKPFVPEHGTKLASRSPVPEVL